MVHLLEWNVDMTRQPTLLVFENTDIIELVGTINEIVDMWVIELKENMRNLNVRFTIQFIPPTTKKNKKWVAIVSYIVRK